MTGVQALARMPIEQLRVDRANGLTTAAFLSGYQGSPLGGFDQEMARAIKQVPDLPIVCQPAVNEELGATAIMGSQLTVNQADARYDGVLGIWYGKAPGLDRATDALRHAIFAGASRTGGAVALVGDDPACKSSTLPSASDMAIINLKMPLFYPGDLQEVLDLARHSVVLSRLAGMWTSIKIVTAVADGSGSVDLQPDRINPISPDLLFDGIPFQPSPNGNLISPMTNEMEQELVTVRLEIARRYGAANDLNRVTTNPSRPWLGMVATGYTYREMLQALRRLGLGTMAEIEDAGIRLMQMQMPYPMDRAALRGFADGLEEIIVVEEKGPTYEWLIKDAIYGGPSQPVIVGSSDETGAELIQSHGFLTADLMLPALRRRLTRRLDDRLTPEPTPEREKKLIPLATNRTPYFCSGCPHNWGTKAPEGALVGAGIGCSGMALFMDEDRVGEKAGITCMGSEGTQWIGMEPFLERDHFIQNLGDGTFFHSGQLAVQAAVAAKVHMTYKLLYNGTVAMTGGQDAAGEVGVPEIAKILLAHGVTEVLITTDDTSAYDGLGMPANPGGERVKVWNRTRIIEAQEHLAGVDGVTVLIHDQACAAQSRRLRKRGLATTPTFKVAINHRICEACGDCGETSNCLSVQSVDTPLGPKTTIDQTSCNRDYSCLEGDCPSFMTIEVPEETKRSLKQKAGLTLRSLTGSASVSGPTSDLPPPSEVLDADTISIRLAGIGGTGVVTVAQMLGTAAMLDGWQVRGLDQTGLSQKAGPVISDLRLSRGEPAQSNLLGDGEADVLVAFDLLVGASSNSLKAASPDRTVLVASSSETPTGDMIGDADAAYPSRDGLESRVAQMTKAAGNRFVDAAAITSGLFGDASTSNVFLLGVALQSGYLPLDPANVERAIDLNGVAVEANLASFRWGRRWAIDAPEVERAAGRTAPLEHGAAKAGTDLHVVELSGELRSTVAAIALRPALEELVSMLAADLVSYQDEAYAGRFLLTVDAAASAERTAGGGDGNYVEAVARGLHKLMAYKDEYEVARLLVGPEAAQIAETVGGPGAVVAWKLHPPLLRALGLTDKMTIPAKLGKPMMKTLAKAKRLRGTPLDPFGRTELRRQERSLVEDYESMVTGLNRELSTENLEAATELANAALAVRGYEELKLERIAIFRQRMERGL